MRLIIVVAAILSPVGVLALDGLVVQLMGLLVVYPMAAGVIRAASSPCLKVWVPAAQRG